MTCMIRIITGAGTHAAPTMNPYPTEAAAQEYHRPWDYSVVCVLVHELPSDKGGYPSNVGYGPRLAILR